MTYRRPCTFRGCTEPDYAMRLCYDHYNKQARIRRANGDADKIPTDAVRAHIQLLRWRGWTWAQIAAAGKTSTPTLNRVAAGELATMRRDKTARILAIPATWQHTRTAVPTVGTRRRLSALAWQGWSRPAVARELGMSPWTLGARNRHIHAFVAAAVAEFYDRHAHLPGPSPAYARKARTLGAIPAAAWDDDAIDDPRRRPIGVLRAGEAS